MAKKKTTPEWLGRDYVGTGLKALKAGIENRLAEIREQLSSMDELREEETRLAKELEDLAAEIEAAGGLPEVDLQVGATASKEAKPEGQRRKTKPKASPDQIKAMVLDVLGDRTLSLEDIKEAVNEQLKEQGKTAQGVHKTLQKVLKEKPFEETAEGYRNRDAK